MALRQKLNKVKSAKEFRRNASKTKAANVPQANKADAPMRGGWRL